MSIKINGRDLSKRMINGREVIKVMKNGVQVRPSAVPPVFDNYLCFTAKSSNRTISLNFYPSQMSPIQPTSLEISYDKTNWTDYTLGNQITLSSIGDKVYFRNKSDTTVGFSDYYNTYLFQMGGSGTGGIDASGDVTTLICKYGTTTLPGAWCFNSLFSYNNQLYTAPELPATTLTEHCYQEMFRGCALLSTATSLPATTLTVGCYASMFQGCASMITIPELPATTLPNNCYDGMFSGCTALMLYTSQSELHPNEYRIPTSGTGTAGSMSLSNMFPSRAGGEFAPSTPSINTTYYTSNTIV